MRRSQALALSLLLAAAPAAAQQTADVVDPTTEPTAPAAPAKPAAPVQVSAPAEAPLALPRHDARLDVDREQARKSFDADAQHQQNVLAGHPWWWLVAAVAAGIVIAAIITS
jgi:hypothetical protein